MPLKRRQLGKTGLEVSPIAIGGASFAYVQESMDWNPLTETGRALVERTIDFALDQGINYIDTAAYYGDGYSESLIGAVMKRRRSDCVLASKVWFELDYQGVRDSVTASLERLQCDHIDIMQVHGRYYSEPEIRHVLEEGPLHALCELRDAGLIKHIGITAEEPWTLIPFLEIEAFEVYQIAYNLIYQNAAMHLLQQAHQAGVGIVTMRTMTSGMFQRQMHLLAPELEATCDLNALALRFNLSDSRIHSSIVGMRWPHEVAQNLDITRNWQPEFDLALSPRTTVGIYQAADAVIAPEQRRL